MARCLAITLVKDFNRGLLKPYAEFLLTCQELVILVNSSADDIKSRETKYQDGLVYYKQGIIIGKAVLAVGAATGPAVATAGVLLTKSAQLSEAVHSLVKDLQNWQTHRNIKSLIDETKILEKLSAVLDKIERLNGVKGRESRKSLDENWTQKQKTGVLDVDKRAEDVKESISKIKDAIALGRQAGRRATDRTKSGRTDGDQSSKNSSSGIWSISQSLTTGFDYALGVLSLVGQVVKWSGIQERSGSAELINITEVLMSALTFVTSTVREASEELQAIVEAHLSDAPSRPCDRHHGSRKIVNFFTTSEELVSIDGLLSKTVARPEE